MGSWTRKNSRHDLVDDGHQREGKRDGHQVGAETLQPLRPCQPERERRQGQAEHQERSQNAKSSRSHQYLNRKL